MYKFMESIIQIREIEDNIALHDLNEVIRYCVT